jgi:hypothetical protein
VFSTKLIDIWALRLLLAILFIFGAELLLWTNPLQHSLTEWVLRIIGYLALATLILDFAVRYRIREVYDALVLMGIYGLLVGLMLQPQTSFADFPRTLMTRVMGGHTLIGVEMFGLFLALTGGHIPRYRRLLLGFSLWLGFYWGIWVRWSSLLTDLASSETDLFTMFACAGVVFILALIVFIFISKRHAAITPLDFRLSPLGLGVTLIALIVIFLERVINNAVDINILPAVIILIILCYAILWFRRADKGAALLDSHIPPTPLRWLWIVLALVIFSASAIFSYGIPLLNVLGFNQLSVMEFAFALGGLVWLPLVAAVFSVRAIDRQAQKLESL